MKKRVVSILLAALMTLAALPVLAKDNGMSQDEYICCGNWIYVVTDNGEAKLVLYTDNNPGTSVVIPSEIENRRVTELYGSMGWMTLALHQDFGLIPPGYGIEEVSIPDSVNFIGAYTFLNNAQLSKVRMSNNTNWIGISAFQNCSSLKSIYFPARMVSIYELAFDGCTSLETVYYGGTREQWNSVDISAGNSPITSATVYYNHPSHSIEYVEAAPGCTESGAAAHYHCTLCGKDFLDEAGEIEFDGETVPAVGHTAGDWALTTAPSCTEAGVESLLCARCGEYVFDTRPVAALGHDYRPVSTTAPTCTEDGFTTFVCSRCGDSYNSDGQSAPGHFFGDWMVTTAPSCTESGVETRYCSRCDAFETRVLAPTGHSFGDWTVTTAPTCTEGGEKIRYCTGCGASETRAVAATGHKYTSWYVLAWETCTTDGEYIGTCAVCGHSETMIVPATGHSYIDGHCRTCYAEDPSAPRITVSSETTKTRGDRFDLTVSVKYNTGVSSMTLGLDYNMDALKLESVTNGDLFGEIADFDLEDGGGCGTLTFDSESNVTGDGVLLTLSFKVSDRAWSGLYDVGVFVRGGAVDENGDDADFLWFEGIVPVVVYGDVNLEGNITGMDASLVLQYAANFDDETGESTVDIPLVCADVNGDGRITVIDASLILQYVANYDDETGTSTVVLGPTP